MPIERICTVAEAVKLNEHAYSFTLEVGDMSPAGPGEFVHIKCGDSLLLRRPISICSWQEGLLRMVFEVRGEGTDWLVHRKAGDQLSVLGTLGKGFRMGRQDKCLLVGGGIGVPPMLGCANWTGGKSTAILGFRSADRAMLQEEFAAACANVKVATDDGSLGYHGYVDALVRETLEKEKDFTVVAACGPKPMLRNVARVAAEFGVPCQVSLEERMACGVGACLGCAVQMVDGTMKHVCKDGPVFDAREVDWNV